MRRLLIIAALLVIVVLGAGLMALNSGLLQNILQEKISEASGARVQLGPVKLVPLWPLSLAVGTSTVDHPLALVSWKSLNVEIGKIFPPYKVTVKLSDPSIRVKTLPAEQGKSTPPPSATGSGGGVAAVPPLDLTLSIRGGEIVADAVHIRGLDVDFVQTTLLKTPASLRLKALVESKSLPVPMPVSVSSDNLTLSPEKVAATDLKVSLAGLVASGQGTSQLVEGRHRWKAQIQVADLGKLPQPPLPATGWQGSLRLNAEVSKDGPKSGWSVQGDLQAQGVRADLNLKQDKLTLKGPFTFAVQTRFSYSDAGVSLPQLNADIDFTQTELVYGDLLFKPRTSPFKLVSSVQGDQNQIQIQDLQFNFWKIAAKVQGRVDTKAPYNSNLKIDIPSFVLADAEKVFLPLSRQPVEGEMGLNASLEGPLIDPMKARLNIESLKLKNLSASFSYEKPGVVKVSGPLRTSFEAKVQVDKGILKQADIKGKAALSDIALSAGPMVKQAKQTLNADFQVRNVGEVFELQNFAIDSFVGQIRASGKISNPADPTVQIRGEVRALNLAELRLALPQYRDKIPKGTVNGTFSVNGKRANGKDWQDWPMMVAGDLRVALTEYVMASAPPAPAAKDKPDPTKIAPPEPTGPFLPPGNLTKQLNIKYAADVALFKKEALEAKGVHSAGVISGGHLKGSAQIQQVFGGSVQVSGLDVPLLDARPAIQGAVKWQNLIIQDALGFAKPQYKEFATGKTAGGAEFQTFMPADKDFMKALKARGKISLQPVTLNSIKVGDMINDLIKKAPMLKMQPVKAEPMHGAVNSDFDLRNEILQIEKLTAQEDDGSELELKGKVVVPTLQGDFVGNFAWAKPQVQGCLVEGNSDAKGRMVIPMAIKGDLMHPGFSLLSDMATKLGARALECEKKKLVEKLKQDGGKKLEEEGKKLLKGILGN